MTKKTNPEVNVTEALTALQQIVAWFDAQENVDVEAGIVKVREATTLIKASRARLTEIENEFRELEKDMQAIMPHEA